MRSPLPEHVEAKRFDGPECTNSGAFMVTRYNARLKVLISDGWGWDHVSVSLATRTPTWEEMAYVKDLFFAEHEVVMQLHPAKENYVNNHPFCLHLWRPQSDEEIRKIRDEWGEEWPYGNLPSPGVIPLPQLLMV